MNVKAPSQTLSQANPPDNKLRNPFTQKDLGLSYQVQSVLNRLRHNLQTLLPYKAAGPEEIRRIKLQIIDDIIRPMRAPELLKDLLIYCDLVTRDFAFLEEAEIEREIIRELPQGMLVASAKEIMSDVEELRGVPEGRQEEVSRRLLILRDIGERLSSMGSVAERDFIKSFLNRALSQDDLPADTRHDAETAYLADTFLAEKSQYLERIAGMSDDEAGRTLTALLCRILPELARRREYATLAAIIGTAQHGTPTSAPLKELAGLLSHVMASPDTIRHLLNEMNCQDKERRKCLMEILALIGSPAVLGLLEAYAKSDSKPVRMSLFETVSRIGTATLQSFLSRLPEIEPDPLLIFHILETVGGQGDVSLAEPVARFLEHPNPHVRRAALAALFKLKGPAAESSLLKGLRDSEALVRQTSVEYLGRMNSRHPQALEWYLTAFGADDRGVRQETDEICIEVCKTLAISRLLPPDYIRVAENILLAALGPSRPKTLLSWFKKPLAQYNNRLRVAICKALEVMGTSGAIAPLRQISDSETGAVAEAAAAAAKSIQERHDQAHP